MGCKNTYKTTKILMFVSYSDKILDSLSFYIPYPYMTHKPFTIVIRYPHRINRIDYLFLTIKLTVAFKYKRPQYLAVLPRLGAVINSFLPEAIRSNNNHTSCIFPHYVHGPLDIRPGHSPGSFSRIHNQ